jgi:hypothetical protein
MFLNKKKKFQNNDFSIHTAGMYGFFKKYHTVLWRIKREFDYLDKTRVRGYEGTRVRGYEGTRVRGYEGTRVRGYEGTRVYCLIHLYKV